MQSWSLKGALEVYQQRLEAWARAQSVIESVSKRVEGYDAIPYNVTIMPGIAPSTPFIGHVNIHVRAEDMDDFVTALRQRTGLEFERRRTARGGYAAISDNVEFNVDVGPIELWRKRKAD